MVLEKGEELKRKLLTPFDKDEDIV